MVSRNRIWAKKINLPLNLSAGDVISTSDIGSVRGLRGLIGVAGSLFLFLASVFLFLFVAFSFGAGFLPRIIGGVVLLFGVEFFAYSLDSRLKFFLLKPVDGFDFYVFYANDAALDLQLERILEGRASRFSMYNFFSGLFLTYKRRETKRGGFDITEA